MTKYYTVTTPETGKDGKTRFPKVGVAFPQSEGSKSVMTIQLFATPVNGELVLFEPKADIDDGQVTE
ncbi:MAG: hypothetical protein ACRBBK_14030 [Paracoccaceae bacterium]|uniref:hypothetical protein n=1 Tax=Celeribacter marinus TaxID=1397108 RepID=UPI0031708DB1